MKTVVVSGGFDDIRSRGIRFLQEAARLGDVHCLLWPDAMLEGLNGRPPKFPLAERQYFLEAVRYVKRVIPVSGPAEPDALPRLGGVRPEIWAVEEGNDRAARKAFCAAEGLDYRVIRDESLKGFPVDRTLEQALAASAGPRVVVTGCYDWFHSGHVRFFEEVSEMGELYVAIGNDANIRLLKGEGHPLFSEQERRYVAGAIRTVACALVSAGSGWLDAEAEIRRIKPAVYAVNEDGDKPEKRVFCREQGIRYVVLKRLPREGLPRRQSTNLRGF